MMVSVGLGELGVEASMSHLMSHASFKAGLFLAAGVVITSAGGYPTSKLQVNTYSLSNLCMLRSPLQGNFNTYSLSNLCMLRSPLQGNSFTTNSIITNPCYIVGFTYNGSNGYNEYNGYNRYKGTNVNNVTGQYILLYKSTRSYTTGSSDNTLDYTLDNSPIDILPNYYVDHYSQLTFDVIYAIKRNIRY